MNSTAATIAAQMKTEYPNAFENIFTNIQNKLNEFEDLKATLSFDDGSAYLQDIQHVKNTINNAFEMSEKISRQREQETQLIDQWFDILHIKQQTFANPIQDDELIIPEYSRKFNTAELSLYELSTNLTSVLRDLVENNKTPEMTRLEQILLKIKAEHQNRVDFLKQLDQHFNVAESKFNSLSKENLQLMTELIKVQEYTNTFSDKSAWDAIQKAKKIKLATELKNAKEKEILESIDEMHREIRIYKDTQKSFMTLHSQMSKQETEKKNKITESENEMKKLNQEISNNSLNSKSLFASLEKELENTRKIELNYQKNQTDTQTKSSKTSFDRLISKLISDEKEDTQKVVNLIKSSNPKDPTEAIETNHLDSITQRKELIELFVTELKEISSNNLNVIKSNQQQQEKHLTGNDRHEIEVLTSYLHRMKAKISKQNLQITAMESRSNTMEDLMYDIVELAFGRIGENSEEVLNEFYSLRKELNKDINYLSKSNYLCNNMNAFLDQRIELARDYVSVDGCFSSRPNSARKNKDEVFFKVHDYYSKKKETLVTGDPQRKIVHYDNEARSFMANTGKIRIPQFVQRRGPITEKDLQPDPFEIPIDWSKDLPIPSSLPNDNLVVVDGKVGFIKDGKFVPIDPDDYKGKTGYFKDGVFVEFDPSNGIPDGIPDGTFVIINGQAGYIKNGKFVPVDPSKGIIPDGTTVIQNGIEGVMINGQFVPKVDSLDGKQSGVFINGKFVPLDQVNPNDIKDGTFAIIGEKKGVFINGKFVEIDENKLRNILPPGAELVVKDGQLGYIDENGNFVAIDPNKIVKDTPKNGVFINGKFVEFDPEKGLPDNLEDGTLVILNGQTGYIKDGKFVPAKNGYIDANGRFVEFDENGLPSDLPDGTVVILNGKTGKIINGKFVPDDQKQINGYFDENGNFVAFDDNTDLSKLADGTTVIINGQTGVIINGKFVPTDKLPNNINGYFNENGEFVPFDPNNMPTDIPDGTVAIINGVKGVFINGKFVPNSDENDKKKKINGYFDENGNFVALDDNTDLSKLADGTTVIINGQTGVIINGKFVPTDKLPNNINGYFNENGEFVPFDPNNMPTDIPDGTVAIINGVQGQFINGKFVPDSQKNINGYFDENGQFISLDPNADLSQLADGTAVIINGQTGVIINGKFVPTKNIPPNINGYFDKDGKFIPLDPNNLPDDIPDGTVAVINGRRGVFQNGKFIPFENDENPNVNGYYDQDGKFIPFDPANGIPANIPDGTIGFMNGKQGIFKNGQFIPFTEEQLRQQQGSGYFDKDGNFIPIDPDSTDFSQIPDGTFGCINGIQGVFKNGKFIPLDNYKAGYIDENGNFVVMDPNDSRFPNDKNVVYGRFPNGSFGLYPYRPSYPLCMIQPIKFKFKPQTNMKKKIERPPLTPEQLMELVNNCPNVQFDPETAAKYGRGGNANSNVFGICNFVSNTKSPRRQRPQTNQRRLQFVGKSTQPSKQGPMFFIKSLEQNQRAQLPPLNRNTQIPKDRNIQMKRSESYYPEGPGDIDNSTEFISPQRRQLNKSQSAYQKLRPSLKTPIEQMKEELQILKPLPPLNDYHRSVLSPRSPRYHRSNPYE